MCGRVFLACGFEVLYVFFMYLYNGNSNSRKLGTLKCSDDSIIVHSSSMKKHVVLYRAYSR